MRIGKQYNTLIGTVTHGNSTWGTVSNNTVYTNPTNVPQTIDSMSLEFDSSLTTDALGVIQYVLWVADTSSDSITWGSGTNLTTYADKVWCYGQGVNGKYIRFYDRAEPSTKRQLRSGQTIKLSITGYGNGATPASLYSAIINFVTK